MPLCLKETGNESTYVRNNRILEVPLPPTIANDAVYVPSRNLDLTVTTTESFSFELEGIDRDSDGKLMSAVNVATPLKGQADGIYKLF